EDFTELEKPSNLVSDSVRRRYSFLWCAQLKTFAPYPNIRDENEAEEIITESLERFAVPPLTDDEMMRQLKFGGMNESVTPEKASAKTLDTANDNRSRDAALKAIYDESIRQGNQVSSCRLRRVSIGSPTIYLHGVALKPPNVRGDTYSKTSQRPILSTAKKAAKAK
ncbi:hypothetical protein, partial [Haladaptatus sp. W1]|uniref:hypothetical protein n=1 Tax=Haladaptatus sp. W1 TaxID=1897478 RepID=UPI001C2F3117